MKTTESAPLVTAWIVTRRNGFGLYQQMGPDHRTECSAKAAAQPGDLIQQVQRRYQPVYGTTATDAAPILVAHCWE
jgi:hypothetical protein